MARLHAAIVTILLFAITAPFAFCEPLPNTKPLTWQGDLAARMVSGIDAYLMREIDRSIQGRVQHWNRDFSSHENYIQSVESNRQRFKKIVGIVDERDPVSMQLITAIHASENDRSLEMPGWIAKSERFTIHAVRWNVFKNVEAEGFLLQPQGETDANVVVLTDCATSFDTILGQSAVSQPIQTAFQLVHSGCRVLLPVSIDRKADFSGDPSIRMTNQPHREYLYRAAYEMGRHIIGYEVQKVLAAVDWYKREWPDIPVGVTGEGEGGLIAFYAAASDTRIDSTMVAGYFQPRETLWQEPIYRNVWSLLTEFGDAEIASLIAPRPLVIEPSCYPELDGPPQIPNRRGAAPGVLKTPASEAVKAEIKRAKKLIEKLDSPSIILETNPFHALKAFSDTLNFQVEKDPPIFAFLTQPQSRIDPQAQMKRQFGQILEHTQFLMRESEFTRKTFWSKADASSLESWQASCNGYKDYFRDEIIGCLPEPTLPLDPRTRLVYDEPEFLGYEVVLDVFPDVFAYGILLVPKGIEPGERRPVVVCQHGLEGRPVHVADPAVDHRAYHRYACELAKRGFITYAPQNPYIGEDQFRVLLRKAQPLKLTLYSFIVRQHQQTLRWLAQLPFTDKERIAFYGLSYGGKTAMRIPALLDGYCLSICSADYNEWIWKNVSARHKYSYLFTGEYDMPEFDLGNTFNYAEMSWLICPRPFMVERGHHDGVAPDEWVAYEFAKTRRRYDLLGIGERTEIEFFNGPHTIHGVGTFDFLHRHLDWPKN